MAQGIYDEGSLFQGATRGQVAEAEAGLGMFTPGLKTTADYMPKQDNSELLALVQNMRQQEAEYNAFRQKEAQQKQSALLAEQKRQQLEESARLKAGEVYRKANPLKDENGQLAQDSNLELMLKKGINAGLDVWNKANDYVPFVEDKTLDVNSRLTGTIAGMTHEDLQNKDIFGAAKLSKKQVLDTVNKLQDDPNGQGTLYYLRKQDGYDDSGKPKYLYKAGFAQLDAADRYRNQANAAGWDIVKEVQSSGSADAEKLIHAKFIGDRALSYDQVKGADVKMHSRDKASGINFGSGYGEIYNKDILGWDKKSSTADLRKYKVEALKSAVQNGITGEQLRAYRSSLDAITPDQLDKLRMDANKAKSYAKRDANDAYQYGRDSDALTAAQAGITKLGREAADTILDIVTPEGLDKTSTIGQWLGADKGNSTRLDQWKEQSTVDKDVGYNRRSANEAANAMVYHVKQGDYVGALSDIFSEGALNMTAESLGYIAPMLVGGAIGSVFTGGGSGVAATSGISARVASLFGKAAEARTAAAEAGAIGDTVAAAAAGKNLTAAQAAIESSMTGTANTMSSLAKMAERGGFYGQSAAMTNERIDQRIKNNGGQPTSMLDNAMVFVETVLENYIDKAVDMSILGIADKSAIQGAYKMLDDVAKQNVLTKAASKAAALAVSAGIEGATEYIQSIGQSIAEQYDTKKNGGTIKGILESSENQEAGLVNFLMGAASGVHMQAVPTGIKTAIEVGSRAVDNVTGATANKEANERRIQLHEQVLNGTADPHTNPVSYTGKDTMSAVNDLNSIVTNAGNVPMEIAHAAILDSMPKDITAEVSSNRQSAEAIITNVDNSLRRAYNIDENGNGSIEDVARYNEATYFSAMQTLKNINSAKADLKVATNLKGVNYDDNDTIKALSTAIEAYKKVLPQATMNQVVLSIATDTINMFRNDAMGSEGEKTGHDIISAGKEGRFEANVESLEKALSRLNAISMGSMDNSGSTRTTNANGSFTADQVSESLTKMKASIQAKLNDAKASKDGKTEIATEFLDHLKSSMQVGSEILFHGKKGHDNGYGLGLYQYGIDLAKNIHKAGDELRDVKLNKELLNGLYKFAMGRYKPMSVGENKAGEKVRFFTKDELKGTEYSEEGNAAQAYTANYIREQDLTGTVADKKIKEAYHFITVAKQLQAALSATSNIKKDDRKYFEDHLSEIIDKQNEDIAELERDKQLAVSRRGQDNTILVDLRKFLYTKPVKDETTGKVIQEGKLRYNVQELINEAMDTGRFSTNEPIYAAVNRKTIFTNTGDRKADTSRGSDKQKAAEDTENKAKQSEVKASVGDNTKETIKEEPENGQNDEQSRERQTPSERTESAKDTEGDQQRAENATETTATTKTESVIKTPLQIAEDELKAIENDTATIAEQIAIENGIEGYKYDTSMSTAENMRELKKLITVKINQYKAVAKAEIEATLGKIEKLSTLLTAAVKGEGLHGISSNANIKEAARLNTVRTTEVSVSKNDAIRSNEQKRKRISKLLERINSTTSIDDKIKYTSTLAGLLGIEYKVVVPKRPKGGFGKANQDVENDEAPSYAYKDEYADWREEDFATFEADVIAKAKEYERGSDKEERTAEAEEYVEENPVYDLDEDGVSAVDPLEEGTKKDVQKAVVAPNIFSSINIDHIKTNDAKIAKVKAELKAYEQKRINEVAEAMARDTNTAVKDNFKAAKEQVKQEMKQGCL